MLAISDLTKKIEVDVHGHRPTPDYQPPPPSPSCSNAYTDGNPLLYKDKDGDNSTTNVQ